jgi:hypothetical protein
LIWAKRVGGAAMTDPRVVPFPDGTFAIAGGFAGEATLGAGEARETHLGSTGSYDIFLARYASNGLLLWATQAGSVGTTWDWAYAGGMSALPDGGLLLVGGYPTEITFPNTGAPAVTLYGAGDAQMFVAKYNAGGRAEWAFDAEGTGYQGLASVAAHSDGTFAVAGWINSSAYFEDEAGVTNLVHANGSTDNAVVAKFFW